MQSMSKPIVCFDLDDTLYKEIDFLKSGYRKISEMVEKRYGFNSWEIYDRLLYWYSRRENAFVNLNEAYGISNPINDYLNVYRYHHPNIALSKETTDTLDALKHRGITLAIITDGREITQRQKIEALGLAKWISEDFIFINEEPKHFKPNRFSFDRLMLHCYEQFPDSDFTYYYIGDNPLKDFLAPNQLGWESVCLLDDGRNIHKQDITNIEALQTVVTINRIHDVLNVIYDGCK